MVSTKNKDRLFKKLFGDPENKENLLSLFNALLGTDYKDASLLDINTIEDVIYLGMANDVSCILDGTMMLSEHQSTINPNMPLRGMMYFGLLYNKYIKQHKYWIYGERLINIPTPKYYVLYNGDQDAPDVTKLKLSDAFSRSDEDGEFEWTATMLNINYGHNEALLKACNTLREYSVFVEKIKHYKREGFSTEDAVDMAVNNCINEGVMRDYLIAHKAEVKSMVITEYDEEEARQAFIDEGFEAGVDEGKILARFEDGMAVELIAEKVDRTVDFVNGVLKKNNLI